MHVAGDLLAQSLNRGKLDLVAHTPEKGEFDGSVGSEIDGMEVQQMAFDGEGISAKSRPGAHVSDGVETFVADAGPGDVDAICGNQFIVATQIDCRHSVLVAVTASSSWRRSDTKDSSEQVPCLTGIAF